MSRPPNINVSRSDTNGFLSAKSKPINPRGRSSSVTPSVKSNVSNISTKTEVYEDPEVVKDGTIEFHNEEIANPPRNKKPGFLDRCLGLFGLCRQGKSQSLPLMATQSVKEQPGWESPWVLPVVVLSNRKDTDRVQVKRLGICTIDTGNTQGNIVSRTFVENVLEYPKSSIKKLTEAEEVGGSGVTGHRLVPEGVIFLTWYHKKSTRVFHNMRFLISEVPNFDLIIGARSIQEHGIHDEPNLMAASNDLVTGGKVVIHHNSAPRDPERDQLRQTCETCDKKRNDLKTKLTEAKNDGVEVEEIEAIRKDFASSKKDHTIAKKRLELHKAKDNAERFLQIQRELDILLGQQNIPTPVVTHSTAVSSQQDLSPASQRRSA